MCSHFEGIKANGRTSWKERTVVCLQFLDGSNVVGLFSIKIMPVMKRVLAKKVYACHELLSAIAIFVLT